jgi:hypothetical protein
VTFRAHPLFLVLLLSGCAGSVGELSQGPEPASESAAVHDLTRLPESVGALRLAAMRAYPDAAMGSHYRYMGEGLLLDVYVYPIDRAVLTAAPGDPEREESAKFIEVLELQRRQGIYGAVRVTGQQALMVQAGARSFPAWRVSALVSRGTAERETHQHLVTAAERFIKVRTTFPVGESRVDEVESFLSELLGMLEIDTRPTAPARPVAVAGVGANVSRAP